MEKDGLEFIKLLDGIENEMIEEAGKEWRQKKTFWQTPAAKAACAALVVLAGTLSVIAIVSSVPTSAKVSSLVTERMESMSEKEKEERLDAETNPRKHTKEHDTEVLRFSREWSEEEEGRFNELRKKYKEEGLFPEGQMQLVDKLEENAEISVPVFEIWNREIFLHERELTDEELLQIIDYQYKAVYVINNSEISKKLVAAQQAFNADPNPGENDLSEEEAITKASVYLEAMYGLDVEKMNKTTEFVMGCGLMDNDQYGEWEVTFKENDEWSYVVNISRQTGRLVQIQLWKEGYFYGSFGHPPVLIDEELYTSVYKKAKSIIDNITDAKITKSTVGFRTPSGGYVNVTFYMDNHYVYQIRYITEDGIFDWLDVVENEYDESFTSTRVDYNLILME